MKLVTHDSDASDSDRVGVDALFRAHAQFVAAFLSRHGVPASDVDDVVQEVFLVAHSKGGYLPSAGQARTWLAAIALRLSRANRRRRSRRELADDGALQAATCPSKNSAELLELRKSMERVQRALDTLDMPHRSIFVLFELDGERCDNIAASFGLPIGTVYSRLHYARKRFLDAYERLAADDEDKLERQRANGAAAHYRANERPRGSTSRVCHVTVSRPTQFGKFATRVARCMKT